MAHWSDEYKGKHPDTFEGKVYLAVCCIKNCDKEKAFQVAHEAMDNHCCIWHAHWLTLPKETRGVCHCSPCVKARGEKPIRLP